MRFRIWALIFILVYVFSSSGWPFEKKVVRIGILADGNGDLIADGLDVFEKEIRDLLRNEYDVDISQQNILIGDWTLGNVKNNLQKLLNSKEVDIILAMGAISSNEISHHKNLSKPSIAPMVIDEKLQELPRKRSGSGVKNLNYVISIPSFEEGLNVFEKVVDFDCCAIAVNKYYLNSLPRIAEKLLTMNQLKASYCNMLPIGDSVDDAISLLTPDIKAVYITPLTHISKQDRMKFYAALNERNIPSFSHLGKEDVEDGVLAGIDSKSNLPRLGRRVAINIQRILMGENAGGLPIDFRTGRQQLVINTETARKIHVYPSFSVLTDAELVNESNSKVDQNISLFSAVTEAVDKNLEFIAKNCERKAGKEDIRIAWANLLPQLDISGAWSKIDGDRAAAASGLMAENSMTGRAVFTQVMFSEKAWANVRISKQIDIGRAAELEQVKQSIALTAAISYLNVLKAKTYMGITKNNIKVTKSNLELAKVRHAIGTSGPGEVYRWEAELANSKRDVLNAERQMVQAEIQLNRMMHRPLDEKWNMLEIKIDDPRLLTGVYPQPEIDNPWVYRKLSDFVVSYGINNAPEIEQIDAGVKAKKRLLKSIKREFYVPSVFFQGDISYMFDESGSGTEGTDIEPLINSGFTVSQAVALGSLLPEPSDDTDWSLGVKISLPLYSGGRKYAEIKRASLEIKQMETERNSIKEQLEQRIRSSLIQVATSMALIDVTKEAATAAEKTLHLVTDAYAKGMATMLDLIDSQNAARTADEVSANAVYDFLIDLMQFERSINSLDFFVDPSQRGALFNAFNKFLEKEESK